MRSFESSDEYIIACVKDGNIEKVSILYDRHHISIYSYFYRLTRNKAESEDLMQNVFLRLINYRNTYKVGHQFLPWVFRIAHNVYYDYCKSKTKEYNCLHLYTLYEEQNESKDDDEMVERFYSAFNQLTPEYRELLIMHRYNGLSYKQIGEALGQNEKAIKQKAFRAIEKLRYEFNKLKFPEKLKIEIDG